MTHPCDGHACDHCYICDVEGRCCLCDPPADALPFAADPQRLVDAVLVEASSAASLKHLIQTEHLRGLIAVARGDRVPLNLAASTSAVRTSTDPAQQRALPSPTADPIHTTETHKENHRV